MIELREYLRPDGHSPFQVWLEDLDSQTKRRVTTHLYRVALGNFSSVKGVGKGVFESRFDTGPGYRIYFGKDGEHLIILLGGGSKQRQQNDIQAAIECWNEFKQRKRDSGDEKSPKKGDR